MVFLFIESYSCYVASFRLSATQILEPISQAIFSLGSRVFKCLQLWSGWGQKLASNYIVCKHREDWRPPHGPDLVSAVH